MEKLSEIFEVTMPDKLADIQRDDLLASAKELHESANELLAVVKLMAEMKMESMPMKWSGKTDAAIHAVTALVERARTAYKFEAKAKTTGKPNPYREQMEKSEYERKRLEDLEKKPKKKGTK